MYMSSERFCKSISSLTLIPNIKEIDLPCRFGYIINLSQGLNDREQLWCSTIRVPSKRIKMIDIYQASMLLNHRRHVSCTICNDIREQLCTHQIAESSIA